MIPASFFRRLLVKALASRWAVPALCALLVSALLLVLYISLKAKIVDSHAYLQTPVLVLDPGHGGFDGGAVSDDGTKESDLNLAIACRCRLIAELFGQKTLMTRDTDDARTDFSHYSEHEDLVHRAEMVNAVPGAILISIHQNDFPTGQPSGAQVLYASYADSDRLGTLTHNNLIRLLDPENRRVAEPAPKKLYLTSHVQCPAILVECGFMSNNFEVQKLGDAAYQTSISLVLVGSLLQFLQDSEIR